MKKSDLKDFDVVELRNGDRGFIYNGMIIGNSDRWGSLDLYAYFEDLKRHFTDVESPLDIMKVKQYSAFCTINVYDLKSIVEEREVRIFWDWVREEVKEVTMAEVEEKFGCRVKIIKEDIEKSPSSGIGSIHKEVSEDFPFFKRV